MSKDTKRRTERDQPQAAPPDPAQTEAVAQTGEAAQPEVAAQAEPTGQDAFRRELDELRDKNLRLLAELQNQQKRAQRDRQDAVRFAAADFARDLLIILDDLERTQESANNAKDVQAVADGVRIVYEHFLKMLRMHGVEQIAAEGCPFDPSVHEAILQQPSEDVPAGTVLQELARGYRMHDRVLRAARVIVSSGPAPTDAPARDNQEG